MAIKKSQLYASLWQSCDELRGGMDASQYKDYILTLLFMKYVSDKAAKDPFSDIDVPEGGSFSDMVALIGNKDIGEKINVIIGAFAEANDLNSVIDQADFDDSSKLGSGKEKQDRLSKLIAIFNNYGIRFAAESTGVPQLTAPQVSRYSLLVPSELNNALSPLSFLIWMPRSSRCNSVETKPTPSNKV